MNLVIQRIDHIGLAVRDLEAAIAFYRSVFGIEPVHREVIESDGVEEVLLRVGDSWVQLLTPLRPDSPVARFLDRRGEGMHHVGLRVDDVAEALEQARASGADLIDEKPRNGSNGTTVAFIHPRSAFGTLVELVQSGRP